MLLKQIVPVLVKPAFLLQRYGISGQRNRARKEGHVVIARRVAVKSLPAATSCVFYYISLKFPTGAMTFLRLCLLVDA